MKNGCFQSFNHEYQLRMTSKNFKNFQEMYIMLQAQVECDWRYNSLRARTQYLAVTDYFLARLLNA